MIPTSNGNQRKPPTRAAHVNQNTRITRQLEELIEGHARRLLYRGVIESDISDQVAEILGVPRPVAERTVNHYFAVILRERDRLRNGIVNTLSHARAVRADLRERAA